MVVKNPLFTEDFTTISVNNQNEMKKELVE